MRKGIEGMAQMAALENPAQTSRTAVYGPVRTVVWQGPVGDRRPMPINTLFPSRVKQRRDTLKFTAETTLRRRMRYTWHPPPMSEAIFS
jgi:hypothetical protein